MFHSQLLEPPSGAECVLMPQRVIRPELTIRPATTHELNAAEVWRVTHACTQLPLDVVAYKYGEMTHAPETIAAYRQLTAGLPDTTMLLYLHRGVQAQCLSPLLPSLLHLTGHRGLSHALRCHDGPGLSPQILKFARAMTENGGHLLIIDDEQIRLGRSGEIVAAKVSLYLLCKRDGELHLASRVPS